MPWRPTKASEGDFPGGVADLHYRSTLDGTVVNRLLIAP